ncbi:MAG: PqqD family protein [Proteobacteria bacterium]|nr:PqqD family protein [Pseudomonadota bacterium]
MILAEKLIWDGLKIPDYIIWKDSDEDIVLFDSMRGCYFSLDDVASAIWKHIPKNESLETTIEALMDVYHADRPTIESDVIRFVENSMEKGLLIVAERETT